MIDDPNKLSANPEPPLREQEEMLVRRFFLGEADPSEQRHIEERILREDAFVHGLLNLEDELIDDYARGALTAKERAAFEQHFLTTAKRRQKLSVAQALVQFARTQPDSPEASEATVGARRVWQAWFQPSWKLLAYAVLLLVAGFFGWRYLRPTNAVEQGLMALDQAFRQQRPLEARISGFAYAPFVVARGKNPAEGDYLNLDEAEVLLRKTARERNDAVALRALGRLYLAKKDFTKAIEQFDLARQLLPPVKPPAVPPDAQLLNDLGVALLEKSRLSQSQGDAQSAALELGRSLDVLNQAVEADPHLLESLFNRALCRETMGLLNQAVAGWNEYLQKDATSRWAEEARRHLQEITEQQNKISKLFQQSYENFVAAHAANDEEKAWEAFRIARNRQRNIITDKLIDNLLNLSIESEQAESDTQLRLLEFAGSVVRTRTGDLFVADQAAYYRLNAPTQRKLLREARTLYRSAESFYQDANLQSAYLLYAQAAQRFADAQNLPEAVLAESWMGYCQTRLSNIAQSQQILNRLVPIYRARKYFSQLSYAYGALADSYLSEDEISRAFQIGMMAREAAVQANDPSCQLRALGLLGTIYQLMGRAESLASISAEAVDLAQQSAPDPQQARMIVSLAPVYLGAVGYLRAALDAQREEMRIAEQSRWPLYESLAYQKIGLLQARLGHLAAAQQSGQTAMQKAGGILDETLRLNTIADASFVSGQILQQSSESQAALLSYEAALAHYEKAPFQYYAYKARQGRFLERLRLGDELGAAQDLHQVTGDLERYREQIAEESLRNTFFDSEENFYQTGIAFLVGQRRDEQAAFALAESARARSLLGLRKNAADVVRLRGEIEVRSASATGLVLAQIRQRLPLQTQVVAYTVLPERILYWVVRADGFWLIQKDISHTTLARQIEDYVALLATPTTTETERIKSLAQSLYADLLEPVAAWLRPGELLCLVPDQELNLLPFSALVAPSSDRFLVQDFPLVIAPSVSAFVLSMEMAAAKASLGDQLLCFGNPDTSQGEKTFLPSLPAATSEVQAISTLYSHKRVLTAAEARESSFFQFAPAANLIHFASHALLENRSPYFSQLVLAPDPLAGRNSQADHASADGALHAYELYPMSLPRTRLVVLSACQTGTGQWYHGEGMMSLTRSFWAAGAPSIVGSLWQVDSSSTKDFMVLFHRKVITEKLPLAEALRQAQVTTLLAEHQQARLTYNWSAFQLFGGTNL